MTSDQAPKRTAKPLELVDLTGKLFPWDWDEPCFLTVHGSERRNIVCFTKESSLRAVMKRVGVVFSGIKRIDDGAEFLTSVPGHIGIILDPYFVGERVRYVDVKRD